MVQCLYISPPLLCFLQVKGAPLKELFGFQKVFLNPGQSVELIFATFSRVFQLVDTQVQYIHLQCEMC